MLNFGFQAEEELNAIIGQALRGCLGPRFFMQMAGIDMDTELSADQLQSYLDQVCEESTKLFFKQVALQQESLVQKWLEGNATQVKGMSSDYPCCLKVSVVEKV